MVFDLTIAGAPKELKAGSLRIYKTANGRSTCSFSIISQDRSYRPALDAEVLIDVDGVRLFGGFIERPHEQGFTRPGIITNISAADFNAYTERLHVYDLFPAGTLKAHLTQLVPYMSAYGVTLDPSQVDGPDLPELNYEDRRLFEVLEEWSVLTSDAGEPYVWNIDHNKVLSMKQPTTVAAPFNANEGGGSPPSVLILDVEVEQTQENYANRIILNMPRKTQSNRLEQFTATAGQTTFNLWYGVVSHSSVIVVTTGSGTTTETVSETPSAADWLLVRTLTTAAPDTLTRNLGGLSAGDIVSFTFDGELRARFIASDPSWLTAPVERLVVVEDIPNLAAGQAMADAYLVDSLPLVKRIFYTTLEPGLEPGMYQTFDLPSRNVVDDGFITEVVIRDYGAYNLMYNVTAVTGEIKRPNWRDVYKLWAGDKLGAGGGMAGSSLGAGTPITVGPGLPFKSVQFNRAGTFGGDADFIYHESENSVVCGGGGSDITAAAFESCQVFGYNNHII